MLADFQVCISVPLTSRVIFAVIHVNKSQQHTNFADSKQ